MSFYVENINFTLRIALTTINCLGFWENVFPGFSNEVFYLYTALWFMYINGNFLVTEVGDLIKNFGDIANNTATATIFLTNAALTVKIAQTLLTRTTVKMMVNECNTILGKQTGMKRTKVVEDLDRETRRFMYTMYTMALSSVILWAVTAEKNELPLRAWVPYDATKSPAYEISFFVQISGLFIAACCNMSMDFLVVSLMAQCKCRLQLVCLSLETLCDDITPLPQLTFSADDERIIRDRLCECIKEHQKVLSCSQDIQNCFSNSVLGQFAVASAIMCVTLYQMAFEAKTLLDVSGMASYLIAILVQVFLYCYYGNELMIQSLKVAESGYQFPWYFCSTQVRTLLLIIVLRARKAVYISAGGLSTLSLATFVSIVRASYSFFTVLSRVSD